ALEGASGPAVLVQVLPGGLSLALDTSLLERELLLLAERLSAPPLVPPRGSGRAGAFVYHSRAFVEGTTLRAWLTRNGELPLRRAVEILRDVLAALAHAHAAHIAHGDLKPENVLLTEGHTLVADTGIVGAVERSLPRGAPGAVTGALCATTYVAPERRAPGGKNGAAAATPADDMFAVGVLVHEMLTGHPSYRERGRRDSRGAGNGDEVREHEPQRARIGRHRIAGAVVHRVEQHREVLHRHEPKGQAHQRHPQRVYHDNGSRKGHAERR